MAKLEDYGIERDPVIEAYKKDIDFTLNRENLKLTMGQRLEKMAAFMAEIDEFRGSARRAARNVQPTEDPQALRRR